MAGENLEQLGIQIVAQEVGAEKLGGVLTRLMDNLAKSAVSLELNLNRVGLTGVKEIKALLTELHKLQDVMKEMATGSFIDVGNTKTKEAFASIQKMSNAIDEGTTRIKKQTSAINEGTLAWAKANRTIDLANAKKYQGLKRAEEILKVEENTFKYMQDVLKLNETSVDYKRQEARLITAIGKLQDAQFQKEYKDLELSEKLKDKIFQKEYKALLNNDKLNEQQFKKEYKALLATENLKGQQFKKEFQGLLAKEAWDVNKAKRDKVYALAETKYIDDKVKKAEAILQAETKHLNVLDKIFLGNQENKLVADQALKVKLAEFNANKLYYKSIDEHNEKANKKLKEQINGDILHNMKLSEANVFTSKTLDNLNAQKDVISKNIEKAKQLSDEDLRNKTIKSETLKLARLNTRIKEEEIGLDKANDKAKLDRLNELKSKYAKIDEQQFKSQVDTASRTKKLAVDSASYLKNDLEKAKAITKAEEEHLATLTRLYKGNNKVKEVQDQILNVKKAINKETNILEKVNQTPQIKLSDSIKAQVADYKDIARYQRLRATSDNDLLKIEENLLSNLKSIQGISLKSKDIRDQEFRVATALDSIEKNRIATNEKSTNNMLKNIKEQSDEYHKQNKTRIEALTIDKYRDKLGKDNFAKQVQELDYKKQIFKYDIQNGLVEKGSAEFQTRANALLKEQLILKNKILEASSKATTSTTSTGAADIASSASTRLSQQAEVTNLDIAKKNRDVLKEQIEYNLKNNVYLEGSKKHHEDIKKLGDLEVAVTRANTAELRTQYKESAMYAAKRAVGYSMLFMGLQAIQASMNAAMQGLVEYDKMLYTFQAVLDVSAEKAKNLEDRMTGLSIAYGEQLSSLNKVALELGRAGTEYDKLAQGTKIVTQLAILTGDTVESSTGALVTYLQVFGKDQFGKAIASVEELGAKLAFLANSSKMNTQDINTFSNYALSTAKAVGMTIDQVNALAVALNNSGKNASTVGTNIRRFSEMLGDTNPKINEFFTSIGVNQKTLQAEIAKGGESSNKAFLGFIKTISSYSKESINVVLNGADTLMRDTILSIANSAPEITKAFSESMNVTSNEINKADLVTQTFERRVTSLVNTIISQFHAMQPALGGVVDGLTWVAENFGKITLAVSAYAIATHRAEIATIAFGVASKATATATWLLNSALMKNPLVMAASIVGGGLLYLADSMGVFNEEVKKNTLAFEDNYNASVKAIENNAKLSDLQKEARKNLAFDTYTKERDKYYEEEATKKKIEQAKKDVQELENLNKQLTNANTQMTSGKNTEAWARMIPHIQKRISELTSKIKEGGKEYSDAMNSAFGKQASSYFTEAFIKNIDEQVSLAGRLSKFEGTKALGLKMLEDLAKTIKQEANKQIPVVLQQFDNPDTRALLQSQWNSLGTLSGESYLEGVTKIMATVQATITGLEAKIKEGKASGIDTSGMERELKANQSLYGVYTNIANIKEKTLSTEFKALKPQKETVDSIYAQRDALKDTALFELQLTQYRNGSWDTAKAYLETAQEETRWARENLEIALSKKENEKDIAKFKRDLAEAELKEAKAKNAVAKEIVAQSIFENKLATDRYIFEQGLSDSAKAKLLTLANQTKELEAQMSVADGDKQRQDIANKQKDLELEKTKAILELEKERIRLLTEEGSRALDMQLAKLSNLQIMLGSMGSNVNETTKMGIDLSNVVINNRQNQLNIDKELNTLNGKTAEDYKKFAGMTDEQRANSEEYQTFLKKSVQDYTILNEKSNAQQVAGYADIAGAMSSMFEQGSKEAEAFRLAQMALVSINAINAILSAGMAPPPFGIASMVAAGAMVAGLVSQIGVTLQAFGGNKVTTTSDAFSAQTANTGIGSVLGDSEKQSESIAKAMETLKDFAQPQYQTLQSMNKYLANISNSIGGVSSLLIQQGGFAFGQGATEFSTGYKNSLDWGNSSKGGALLLQPINSIISKIPVIGQINDMFGSIMGSVMGGLFGKTSVSQALKDSGITFADTLLTSAIKEFNGQAYQTIATTTSKKSWFGSSSSTAISSYFEDLDNETERQFSLVLNNLYNTTLLAGEALDSAQDATAKSLENFVISIGKISLKDKTGDEIQSTLESIFGSIGDNIAKTAFPLLTPFQKVGEGMFETLTRVATGMEEADYYVNRLGGSFKEISYLEILNPQGNVGFEALKQSLENVENAIYPTNNGLLDIIKNLNGTAEELYTVYTSLDELRDRIIFLGQDAQGLSSSMIYGAGSTEELQKGFSDFFENFLTDTEQMTYSYKQLQSQFDNLNVQMPTTFEGFKTLINGLDLTTESGQELYGRLIGLSGSFSDLFNTINSESNIKSFFNSFKTENDILLIQANKLKMTLPSTFEELGLQFKKLSSDTLGLTEEELDYLATSKEYVENRNKELLQLEVEKTEAEKKLQDELLSNVKSNISTIENILDSLASKIDELRASADLTNTYTLDKFKASMNQTLELMQGKNYEAIQESLQKTLGYSSVLMNANNFALSRDMRYAQLVAANQFESMDVTLQTEVDYLKMIEKNTSDTVDALTATLERLGASISSSLDKNSTAFNDMLKGAVGSSSPSVQLVKDIYTKYGIDKYQTDTSGYAYWEQQLSSGKISVTDLEQTIKTAAREKGMLSFAVGTTNVPYDMTANIHQGEAILPRTFNEGVKAGDMMVGNMRSLEDRFDMMIYMMESKFNQMITSQESQLLELKDIRDLSNDSLVTLQTIEKVI